MLNPPNDPFSRFLAARDGLRLHYLDYQGRGDDCSPVVCLPGLTRPAEDFDYLARALMTSGRRVLALDYRGRGESQWDPDWSHYDFDVEQDDILRCLEHAGVARGVFVGTSRGGLHMMRLAKSRPGLICAGVLNDIGPLIEISGLVRIKRYVGKLPPLASIADAIGLTRLTASSEFSAVSAAEWEIYARRSFVETANGVTLRYDPALAHTLDDVAPDMTPHTDWDGFLALARGPLLTLRGENSDILTPPILAQMAAQAPAMERYIVAGQGHAPLLLDKSTIAQVVEFIGRAAVGGEERMANS